MPKVNLRGCRDTILEVAGDALSESDAQDFIDALDHKIRNIDAANLGNVDERIAQEGQNLVDSLQRVTQLNKRNALMSIKAVQQVTKFAKTYEKPFRGIMAFLEDSRKYGEAAGRGI